MTEAGAIGAAICGLLAAAVIVGCGQVGADKHHQIADDPRSPRSSTPPEREPLYAPLPSQLVAIDLKRCESKEEVQLLRDLRVMQIDGINCEFHMTSSAPPVYAPTGDGTYFVLARDMRVRLHDQQLSIPKGFVTDLTSVPRGLWGALPRDGTYMSAAIIHDYLYWDQRCTREQADLILFHEMKLFGVDATKAQAIYLGVSSGGKSAWLANKASKSSRIRVIPEPFLERLLTHDLDATRTYASVESEMLRAGVVPPGISGNPELVTACAAAIAGYEMGEGG